MIEPPPEVVKGTGANFARGGLRESFDQGRPRGQLFQQRQQFAARLRVRQLMPLGQDQLVLHCVLETDKFRHPYRFGGKQLGYVGNTQWKFG